MNERMLAAARARRDGYRALADKPSKRRSVETEDAPSAARSHLRVIQGERGDGQTVRATVNSDGTVTVGGMASVTEQGYEMYDMFGPYNEVVSLDAFDKALSADPLVEFTLNHNRGGGLPMAHTRNGTLSLSTVKEGDETGLAYRADVDPSRSDVADMVKALERGDLAEASFKFRIVRGQWSPDYTEYRIEEVDLERGDVSAVNFGANPLATSAVRSLDRTVRALDPEDVNMLTQAMALFTAIDNIVDEAQETLAAYLKVPNPDADEMQENSRVRPEIRRRPDQIVADDEIQHRTIPGYPAA